MEEEANLHKSCEAYLSHDLHEYYQIAKLPPHTIYHVMQKLKVLSAFEHSVIIFVVFSICFVSYQMEHVLSGIQTCMRDAHEPHLSKMGRLKDKINDSVKHVKSKISEGDERAQKVRNTIND